jgi:peptidoglycan-associated lipoprotein
VGGEKDTIPAERASPSGADTAKPVQSPAKLQLEIAHFGTDSWQIRTADSARLKADAESLKAYPEVKVVIVGHCDPRASESHNRRLGLKRAEAVRDFFVAAGVDVGRISVRSDGEKRPISTKPDEFWLDRRVEFEYR